MISKVDSNTLSKFSYHRFTVPDSGSHQYEPGYRLGYATNGKNYIYNHLKFNLRYHKEDHGDKNTFRVVGFLIEGKSVDKSGLTINEDGTCEINSQGPQEVKQVGETKLHFTYEVKIREVKDLNVLTIKFF